MHSNKEKTEGVKLLEGEPKRAIRKLALPLILSMLFTSIYSIVDATWISALGAEALTGVSFVIPLQLLLMGVGVGLGSGATATISKYIGAKNELLADNASVHSIFLDVLVSVIFTIISLWALKPILIMMGASGANLDYACEYGIVYFLGSVLIILPNALYGIFRAEGDANRIMYAMMVCAVLNMVLDPLFIFALGLGIVGASYATLLSFSIILVLIVYWMHIRNDTYLKPSLKCFRKDWAIVKDICNVAIPASLEFALLSLVAAFMNNVILVIGNYDAVAVYEIGFKVISFGFEPLMGLGSALVAVVGANFGAKKYNEIKIAFGYVSKLGTLFGIIVTVVLLLFAGYISYLFTYSSTSVRLHEPLIVFFRIIGLSFIVIPLGFSSAFVFQGLGRGTVSLVLTLVREIVGSMLMPILIATVFGFGVIGIWLGHPIGYGISTIIAYLFAKRAIDELTGSNENV